LLEAQLNVRIHTLFSIGDVLYLLDSITMACSCVDRLVSMTGPDADSDESEQVMSTLRSPQGEAAVRQVFELLNAVEAKNRNWADRHRLSVSQLDLVEPTPLTVHYRMMVNQFKSLSAQAEAIGEILQSIMGLHHLQFWVLPNNEFHFSGEATAEDFAAVRDGAGSLKPEPPEVTAARIPKPVHTVAFRRIRSTRASLHQLRSLHQAQVRLYQRTARDIKNEFRTAEESGDFLSVVEKAVKLLDTMSTQYDAISTAAAQPPGDGNRSQAYANGSFRGFYDYVNARRYLAEHVGDMDEFRQALAWACEAGKKADECKESYPPARTIASGISLFLDCVTTNKSRWPISFGVTYSDESGSEASTSDPAL
jgi:hypothetical protein